MDEDERVFISLSVRRQWIVLLLVGMVLLGVIAPIIAAPPADIGTRRELFLDHYLIEQLDGTELRLHRPTSAGIAIKFDKPWEGIYAAYATVLHDGAKYRMYYRGHPGGGDDGSEVETTCYAESDDGITWIKPELGLFEVMGTKQNNVVLAHDMPFSHNLSPFLDTRPGVPPAEKYKALAGLSTSNLFAYVSPDGIHWRKWRDRPVFTDTGWVFDSQNVAFWSDHEQCYVLYYRKTPGEIRSVARTTSTDFENWSKPETTAFSSCPPTIDEQLYTNQTTLYFRAPHLAIATAARFMPGRKGLTGEQLQQLGIDAENWLGHDTSDVVLMSTRDGRTYDRLFPQAFVPPGEDAKNWTSRGNYPACGIVQTGPREMSIYVQRNYGWPSHYLERLTMRVDGFSSVEAGHKPGRMITRLFAFAGDRLEINAATSAAGEIRVEIQDEQGKTMDGYSAAECEPIIGDEIARVVSWKSASVSSLAGKPVRLVFHLKEADLYSIRFTE